MAWASVAQAAPVTDADLTFDDAAVVGTAFVVQTTFDASGVIAGNNLCSFHPVSESILAL